ncbi:MAG TPA: caspase family protein [Steroidobacteraceae bacterium]|jgi:hypothetical protein
MNIKPWISCCLVLATLPLRAATLHVILVADTSDAAIGEGAKQNDLAVKEWFTRAATSLHLTPNITLLEDAKFSCEAISTAVKQLTPAADDVVVFYYSGHGFRTAAQSSSFPDFYCGGTQRFAKVTDDSHTKSMSGKRAGTAILGFCGATPLDPYCSLAGVATALKAKGAHLTLAFADTCNVLIPALPPLGQPKFAPSGPNPALTRLLITSSGSVTMSGSIPKQYSWYLPTGGLFTTQLIAALDTSTGSGHAGDWSEVVTLATKEIQIDPNTLPPTTQKPQADNQIL